MTALWYDFKRRRRDPKSPVCRFRDTIPDECARQDKALDSLRMAVRSIRPNGKMHNHQSKVSAALPALEKELLFHLPALMEAQTFGQLHALIGALKTPGIGPMTVYDVAVRFGAWRGLSPKYIYVHAGTAAGLKALGIKPQGGRISMGKLPVVLQTKDADTVEDFLCTYRLAFERLP